MYIYIYIYILVKTRQYPLAKIEKGSDRRTLSNRIERSRNSTKKIDGKSIRESMQNRSRERLRAAKIDSKSVLGASRDAPWRPRKSRGRLGSVPGASRGVPGAPRERPEGPQWRPGTPARAPRSVWERAESTEMDAKTRPGAKKSSFLRAARSRSVVGTIFRRFSSIFVFFANCEMCVSYHACQQKKRFGPSRCLCVGGQQFWPKIACIL